MRNAKSYSRNNALQIRDYFWFIESNRSRLEFAKNELVLDIGCGPGDLTEKVLHAYFPRGTKMIGCDSSEDMISYASANHATEDLQFRVMSIEDPNIFEEHFKEGTFDKIISNYCFHWVKDQRFAAENMHKLLKEGGTLYLSFLTYHPYMEVFNLLASLDKFSPFTKGAERFRREVDTKDPERVYGEMFRKAGFRDVTVSNIMRSHYHPTLEVAISSHDSVDPNKNLIPEHLIDAYDRRLKEKVVECGIFRTENSSDWVAMDYYLCQVYAKK